MKNKVVVAIIVALCIAFAGVTATVVIIYSILRNVPSVAQPTPVTPAISTDQCSQVSTLDPGAFAKYPAGSCVTLVPPAAMSPDPNIWCPVNGDLPLAGNRLTLIGDVKTMLKREGNSFSVITPDREKGVTFVPLEHREGEVVLDGVSLFRERGDGHYTCLVDTLVSIP